VVGFSSSGAKLFKVCMAGLSVSGDMLSRFSEVELSGSRGFRLGAIWMAVLSGSGGEFWAMALRTYATVKIANVAPVRDPRSNLIDIV